MHKIKCHYKNIIGLNNEISYQVGFDSRLRSVISLISLKHAKNQFLCCFKSAMVTDQNNENQNIGQIDC